MEQEQLHRAVVPLLPELRAYARFLATQRAEADDLVQEAIVRALGAGGQFQGGSLRAWLFVILRNTFYEQSRRRRRERTALAHTEADAASVAPAHDGLPAQDATAELADLHAHLFTLSPLLREALVLVGAQGLGYEEAAEICGVPVGTMKARVSRARTLLARQFDRQPAS